MDNISDGLDSSTTFQIVKCIKQMIHVFDKTALISLLQPPPETFELFDDVIILGEGRIVYQGPRENVIEFFESMGFRCPERKGVADYLQEVSSPTTFLFLMKHIYTLWNTYQDYMFSIRFYPEKIKNNIGLIQSYHIVMYRQNNSRTASKCTISGAQCGLSLQHHLIDGRITEQH